MRMLAMSYKKLLIWQRARLLVRKIYELAKQFPKEETYGLTSQIKRAAISIPSNIAEGSQRTSDKEFSNFILIARGSLAELETQCILAIDLKFVTEKQANPLLEEMEEISKMLYSFCSKLTAHSSKL